MPWLDQQTTPFDLAGPPQPPDEDLAAPGFVQTTGAALRLNNTVASSLTSIGPSLVEQSELEEGFNPFDAAKGSLLEAYPDKLSTIYNRKAFDAFSAQVQREQEDARTLAAAGAWGVVAGTIAGTVDVPSLIPGAAMVRAGRVGYSVGRSAIAVGAAAAGSTAAQEGALQATQETRTAAESALSIGGGAVMGALLGAAGAKLLTNAEWNGLAARLEKEMNEPGSTQTDVMEAEMRMLAEPGSAGAAANTGDSLEQLSVAGRAASAVAKSTSQLNPLLRALYSPSAKSRQVLLGMMENPIYLKKNFQGAATDPAVESLVKQYTQGALVRALEGQEGEFQALRKVGIAMKRDEFKDRIGKALRNNDQDVGGDEFVTRAAQAWRKEVFDPLKKQGIEAGLLDKDVAVRTAPSYFHRMYNRPLIEASEQEFKGVVRQWAKEAIDIEKGLKPGDRLLDGEAESYVEDIVTSVYNKITGRQDPADGESPFRIVATTRGPLKERTFDIEDAKIEKYLESDIELVGRRYARVMAADVELARKFGRADLKDQIQEIQADYARLRQEVTDEKLLKKLNKRERDDVADVRAVRDMLRGQYLPEQNASGFARITNAAMTFNYVRAMGGVVLASLTDAARPIMVHGLSEYMASGVKPLLTNLKAVRMSVAEAKTAGVVAERVLNTRLATMSELMDPYSNRAPFERFMENTATLFSKATLMPHWNDFHKGFASVMTQNRILRGSGNFKGIKDTERAYLAYLGVDESMAGRIARQFEAHGQELDGVFVAGTNQWTDDIAVRTYRAAVAKDVDSVIVSKGVGDTPLFSKTPVGRAMLQFKGFALASHQRVLLRGLQEEKSKMVQGLIAMTTIGAFISFLKSRESNRGENFSNNPGQWIAEGLDRSGIFALMFEINNTAEKIGAPGIYRGLQSAFPNKSQKAPASRYASRSVVDAALGPSVGLAKDAVDLMAAGAQGELAPADIDKMRRLTPGATLPFVRSLFDYKLVPAAKDAFAQ